MLLTKVLIEQVNTKAASEEYGISIVNIPDFDYKAFVNGLSSSRHISIFFLGFSGTQSKSLIAELPEKTEAIHMPLPQRRLSFHETAEMKVSLEY